MVRKSGSYTAADAWLNLLYMLYTSRLMHDIRMDIVVDVIVEELRAVLHSQCRKYRSRLILRLW